MDPKSILLSKTLWANVIAFGAALLGAHKIVVDPDTQATLVAAIMAVLNIGLRLVTKGPVTVTGSSASVAALIAVGALSACATQQKIDTALASDGAKQGFVIGCAGAQFAADAAVSAVKSPGPTADGVIEAAILIKGLCKDGPPATAAELEARLGKIAIEDQYVRALVVKALGG